MQCTDLVSIISSVVSTVAAAVAVCLSGLGDMIVNLMSGMNQGIMMRWNKA